jgi:hypothetical protein
MYLINQAVLYEKIWGSGDIAPSFLMSALDRGEWLASRPSRLTPREISPGIRWTESWMGLRVGLDAVEERKILPARSR